jgi:hypothetical protein
MLEVIRVTNRMQRNFKKCKDKQSGIPTVRNVSSVACKPFTQGNSSSSFTTLNVNFTRQTHQTRVQPGITIIKITIVTNNQLTHDTEVARR